MALYPVPLDNSGPQEVSSLTSCPEQAQPSGQIRLLMVLSFEGWKPSSEGGSNNSWALSPLSSWGKSSPYLPPFWPCSAFSSELSPAPLASLPGLCLPGTGLHSAPAPVVRGSFWSLPRSGPGPSQWDIGTGWGIIILLAVTELFRTCWSLLEAKPWRTHAILMFFCMFK